MNQARLVIYRSATGRDNWQPVAPGDVPAWVKAPDVMGRMVAGQQCMDTRQGDKGSDWYMAKLIVSVEERAMVEGALQTLQ